jgi:hypothetical protein
MLVFWRIHLRVCPLPHKSNPLRRPHRLWVFFSVLQDESMVWFLCSWSDPRIHGWCCHCHTWHLFGRVIFFACKGHDVVVLTTLDLQCSRSCSKWMFFVSHIFVEDLRFHKHTEERWQMGPSHRVDKRECH